MFPYALLAASDELVGCFKTSYGFYEGYGTVKLRSQQSLRAWPGDKGLSSTSPSAFQEGGQLALVSDCLLLLGDEMQGH